jgi:hypothetical protein
VVFFNAFGLLRLEKLLLNGKGVLEDNFWRKFKLTCSLNLSHPQGTIFGEIRNLNPTLLDIGE